MGALFDSPPAPTQTETPKIEVSEYEKAIFQLKVQKVAILKYQKRIKSVVELDKAAAKKFAKEGEKEKAKFCLQRKKLQEAQLEKADANLANLEELINTMEWSQIQQQVYENIKLGTETLKSFNEQLTAEDIEEILLDTEEALAQQKIVRITHQNSESMKTQEIQQLFTDCLNEEDDEEILRELEALGMELGEEEEPLELPSVPKVPLKKNNKVQDTTKPTTTKSQSSGSKVKVAS